MALADGTTFLGVDLGTSALKAVLVDSGGAIIAEESAPLAISNPRPDWSEQNPDEWWSAFGIAMDRLRAEHREAFRQLRAIGLSGQMHGAVLLDRNHTPIRAAILWNDGRSAAKCAELLAAVPDLPRLAGIVPMPGFTAPKLLWLRRHEPETFAQIATIVSPKDYLRLKLTGELATDMSDAAGTLWLDQQARDWSDPVLAASGLQRSHMPRLVEGTAASGNLRPELAKEWGIAHPVIVAGGAGDVAAASIGIGAVNDGDIFVSLGTSAQFVVTDDRYRPSPELLVHTFAHALPGRWFRMAAMLNGASCLEWTAKIVGEPDVGALLDQTERAYRGPSGIIFLPYLSGERTPHNDPHGRGAFVGLDIGSAAADLVQATLEGVAFSLLEARGLLESAGVQLQSVGVVGGGARSRFWMQLLAHVLGLPVVRYDSSKAGSALGAARLAIMALTGGRPDDICPRPPVVDVLEPDAALHAKYRQRFEAYRRLYPALRSDSRR